MGRLNHYLKNILITPSGSLRASNIPLKKWCLVSSYPASLLGAINRPKFSGGKHEKTSGIGIKCNPTLETRHTCKPWQVKELDGRKWQRVLLKGRRPECHPFVRVWLVSVDLGIGATTSDKQKGNKKHSKYLGNVTSNVGLVREIT